MRSRLHSRSARPCLAITRTCRQIRAEALNEIYRNNTFEVEAVTQYSPNQRIVTLPGSLSLDHIRELVLVTYSEVSRFESFFAYEVLKHLKQLRKLSLAMKTTAMGGGPDFYSCLETLNIIVWVPVDVQVEFLDSTELMHHDHPTWICPAVLAAYFARFAASRGAGLRVWDANVVIAYDTGLDVAKSLRVL